MNATNGYIYAIVIFENIKINFALCVALGSCSRCSKARSATQIRPFYWRYNKLSYCISSVSIYIIHVSLLEKMTKIATRNTYSWKKKRITYSRFYLFVYLLTNNRHYMYTLNTIINSVSMAKINLLHLVFTIIIWKV